MSRNAGTFQRANSVSVAQATAVWITGIPAARAAGNNRAAFLIARWACSLRPSANFGSQNAI